MKYGTPILVVVLLIMISAWFGYSTGVRVLGDVPTIPKFLNSVRLVYWPASNDI